MSTVPESPSGSRGGVPLEGLEVEIAKGHEQTSGDEEHARHLPRGDGSTSVNIIKTYHMVYF